MRKLPLIVLSLFASSIAYCFLMGNNDVEYISNPRTSRPDLITNISTANIVAGTGVTVVANSTGVTISATAVGGGGGSPLEVFSNFDGVRSSPTLAISVGDALKLSASGSTATVTVDFSSVPSRSDVILNQSSLQSGATFYVSSGTISDSHDELLRLVRKDAVGPFRRTYIGLYQDYGAGDSLVSKIGFSGTDGGGDIGGFGVYTAAGLPAWGLAGILGGTSLTSRLYNASGTFYTAFQSSNSLAANRTWTYPLVDGSATHAMITNGSGQLSFGLAAPIGYGSQYSIQVADGSGGTATSGWVVNPSVLGLTDVAFGPNFFATQNAGVGLGGVFVIYSPSLANTVSFGSPDSGWSENYRFDFPATRLTTNQVWTTTTSAHPGNRVQLVNTPVIISTTGLQVGATFYVSSGTVNNLNIGSGGIKYQDGTVQVSSPTPNPAKDYWWVGSGTLPLEPKGDSVAAVNITTGTNVDVLSADYDSAAEECRGVNFVVPSEVDTSTDVLISPYWMSVSTNSGSVVWKFYHNNGITTGSSFDQVGQVYSFSATSVASSTGTLTVSQFSLAVSSLTWSASEMVDGRICRDASNASDTMTGDAKLNGLRIRIPMK